MNYSELVDCNGCNNKITLEDIAYGMNMPYVTDGPVYMCFDCDGYKTDDEVVQFIDNFINPIKEMP